METPTPRTAGSLCYLAVSLAFVHCEGQPSRHQESENTCSEKTQHDRWESTDMCSCHSFNVLVSG